MKTIADARETLEAAEILLQEILNEETLEFFTGEKGPLPVRAGSRLLAIGPMLYDRPRDCLQISLWELLATTRQHACDSAPLLESLFRPSAWALAESVTMETTWYQFKSVIIRTAV